MPKKNTAWESFTAKMLSIIYKSQFFKLVIQYPLKQRIHSVNMLFRQGSKLSKFGNMPFSPGSSTNVRLLLQRLLHPEQDGKWLVYTHNV